MCTAVLGIGTDSVPPVTLPSTAASVPTILLLALIRKGLTREEAYQLVQTNSLKAWHENLSFIELLKADPGITRYMNDREIEDCFSLEPFLQKIDFIFKRVLS